MDEVDELLAALFRLPAARRVRFAALFAERTGLDPFVATTAELERVCASAGLRDAGAERSARIDFLFESQVRPYLGSGAVMVHDFPPDQASLARVSESDPPTAERFELYVDTIEVANGYRELTDCEEQRSRFERDLDARARAGLARPELDERLLAALASGLPECSGVALGIDRLLMAAWRRPSIDEVIAFPVERA